MQAPLRAKAWAIDDLVGPQARAPATMFAYILKRLLLMMPTLLGVLLLTFVVIQFVPGGPVEQYLAEAKRRRTRGQRRAAAAGYRGAQGVDPAAGADQGPVRLRQAGARALLADAGAVCPLRPGQELLPEQGRVGS
jgi:hypothetical protein